MKTKMVQHLHKILIALDGNASSDYLIDYGYFLAQKMDAEIAVVHISELPMATPFLIDALSNEVSTMVMEVMEAQEDLSKKLFKHVQKIGGTEVPLRVYAKVGKPKEEILAVANEYRADLIILGAHSQSWLDHFILGSVSEDILRKITCPVLVIPNRKS